MASFKSVQSIHHKHPFRCLADSHKVMVKGNQTGTLPKSKWWEDVVVANHALEQCGKCCQAAPRQSSGKDSFLRGERIFCHLEVKHKKKPHYAMLHLESYLEFSPAALCSVSKNMTGPLELIGKFVIQGPCLFLDIFCCLSCTSCQHFIQLLKERSECQCWYLFNNIKYYTELPLTQFSYTALSILPTNVSR